MNFFSEEGVVLFNQGFGPGAARSRGIWLEPEPSL